MGVPLPGFFISRAGGDAPMAAKVGQILAAAGHRVVLQQWDFANRNFMAEMDAALASGARVIAILTPVYLTSDYCRAEWMHALAGDPLNRRGRLIVLRVAPCEPTGLLRSIAYWDAVRLAGRSDADALLADIVAAAVMPDAQRRTSPVNGYWRAAATITSPEVRRTPHFTGRTNELYDIDFALQEGGNAALSQTATIRGMGGAGKSTLAREYAFQVLETDAYAGIWWLNAEKDPDTQSWSRLEQDLVALGDKFQPGLANARDRTAAARWALDQIANGGFDRRWLLVYDNVDDVRVLEHWRPRGNVHLLATTRLKTLALAHGSAMTIPVGIWRPQDAADYLVSASGRRDISASDFDRIAHDLGYLPLALSHAAAYLASVENATAGSYLAAVAAHLNDVPEGAAYDRPVFATFRAAMEIAEQRAPGAQALLSMAAYHAPDNIPEELFAAAPDGAPPDLAAVLAQPAQREKAIGALGRLSLLEFDSATRTLSIHRVVQAAARDTLGPQTGRHYAHAAVDAAFAALPEPDPSVWPRYERLVSHVRTTVEHAGDELGRPLWWLLTAAASYLQERAALDEVMPLLRRAQRIAERLAKADAGNAGWQRDLSVSYSKIGDVLVEQGNLADALEAYRASHAIFERLAQADAGNAGWQHDVALSLQRVGFVAVRQNDLAAARAAYERGHRIMQALVRLAPDHAAFKRDLEWFDRQIAELR